jgi:hypothetical protein
MFKLKSLALAAFAMLAMSGVVRAQVPSYAPPPLQPPTFYASFTALAVPQTAAMDAVCLVGSATKLIKITRISFSGVDSTAQAANVNLVKRSVASTGGTSTAATTVAANTSAGLSATAVLRGYTVANTPGAGVAVRAVLAGFGPATVAAGNVVTWTVDASELQQPVTLNGGAQSACINIPAALTTAGVALNADVTWTEQ